MKRSVGIQHIFTLTQKPIGALEARPLPFGVTSCQNLKGQLEMREVKVACDAPGSEGDTPLTVKSRCRRKTGPYS
jgi:hypothetical protein